MTPADLLAGVVIAVVIAPLVLRALGRGRRDIMRVHVTISLLPPSIDVTLVRRSD